MKDIVEGGLSRSQHLCSNIVPGAINLDPPYGNVLGGTGVMVSGTQFLIREDDGMLCIFDGIEVRGVYVDEKKALCISPLMSQTGRLLFQIIVNGSNSFLGESIFTSCKDCKKSKVVSCNFTFSILQCQLQEPTRYT